MSFSRAALIHAYKPETVLLELVKQLHASGYLCVVVDDGSGERYAALFQDVSAYASVLTHTDNQGKGSALKTGLAYLEMLCSRDCTIVTLDADGQHRIEDVNAVCSAAAINPETLVLGSRALREKVPLRSRLGNTVTRWVYRASTGIRVHDTQTGLRAFNSTLIPRLLKIPGTRYEYEMNVLLELAREKHPMQEVRISTVYYDRNSGSHFNTFWDSCRIYWEILKFSSSSLVCFCVDYSLYSLLTILTAGLGATGLFLSNLGARMVSASMNYTINRTLVFRSSVGAAQSAFRYFLLATLILAGNTWLLGCLVKAGIGRYGAKLIVELVFFVLNWTAQRFFVFRCACYKEPAADRGPITHD